MLLFPVRSALSSRVPRASTRRVVALSPVILAAAAFGVAQAAPDPEVPKITSELVVAPTAGATFQYVITATGAPAVFGASALPAGLTLDSASGVITGAARYPLEYTVPVFATNDRGSGAAMLHIAVQPSSPAPAIVTPDRDTAVAGARYAYLIGCVNPATQFEVIGLPEGLQADGPWIRGTPRQPGLYPIYLRASNGSGTATETLTLSVLDADGQAGAAPGVTQVVAPRDGHYVANTTCLFTVWFNTPVSVVGSPRLAVTVGSQVRYAEWTGAPLNAPSEPTRTLRFALEVRADDAAPQGIALAPTIDLNGGRIVDVQGQAVSVGFTPPDTRQVVLDAWPQEAK